MDNKLFYVSSLEIKNALAILKNTRPKVFRTELARELRFFEPQNGKGVIVEVADRESATTQYELALKKHAQFEEFSVSIKDTENMLKYFGARAGHLMFCKLSATTIDVVADNGKGWVIEAEFEKTVRVTPDKEKMKALEVATEAFMGAVTFAAISAERSDDGRPALRMVSLRGYSRSVEIAGTDGFALHIVKLHATGLKAPKGEWNAALHSKAVKALAAMVKKYPGDDYVTVYLDDKCTMAEYGPVTVFNRSDIKYPDYMAIVDTYNKEKPVSGHAPEAVFAVTAGTLSKVAQDAIAGNTTAGKSRAPSTVLFRTSGENISAVYRVAEKYKASVPVGKTETAYEKEHVIAILNAEFLRDATKSAGDKTEVSMTAWFYTGTMYNDGYNRPGTVTTTPNAVTLSFGGPIRYGVIIMGLNAKHVTLEKWDALPEM